MAGNVFLASARTLSDYALQHESILVAYSGGKDSLCVLDLCSKAFKRVVCYFMYFVDGLEICEKQLEFARQRWGVEILKYPHWLLLDCLRDGIYCNSRSSYGTLPDLGPFDIKEIVMSDTGIDLCADGSKASDSIHRRRTLANTKHRENVIYPIKDWNKYEVLAYLKLNNIPLPDSQGGATTGIDLSLRTILWLYDKHPSDFEKLEKQFPFVRAAVCRRDFYGVQG